MRRFNINLQITLDSSSIGWIQGWNFQSSDEIFSHHFRQSPLYFISTQKILLLMNFLSICFCPGPVPINKIPAYNLTQCWNWPIRSVTWPFLASLIGSRVKFPLIFLYRIGSRPMRLYIFIILTPGDYIQVMKVCWRGNENLKNLGGGKPEIRLGGGITQIRSDLITA